MSPTAPGAGQQFYDLRRAGADPLRCRRHQHADADPECRRAGADPDDFGLHHRYAVHGYRDGNQHRLDDGDGRQCRRFAGLQRHLGGARGAGWWGAGHQQCFLAAIRCGAELGGGGFHITTSTSTVGARINPGAVQIGSGSTLTNILSGNSPTLTFTATPGWSSQDQAFTLTGLPPAVPAPGDFVQVSPPSLAATGVSYWGMCTALGSLSSVASVATVNIRLVNSASASLASNSGVYRWMATRAVP